MKKVLRTFFTSKYKLITEPHCRNFFSPLVLNIIKVPKKLRWVLIGLITLSYSQNLQAQLSGTYTIPGSYASIAAAVTALNTVGVSGPVTFNIGNGTAYTETAPVGGYAIGSAILNTGGTAPTTATNKVTFQLASGTPSATITAYTGVVAASNTTTGDAIFILKGAKWITINGLILKDPNTVTTGAADMEYGFLILNSGNIGAQNNLIENCSITLYAANKYYTYGIYQIGSGSASGGDNSNNTYSNVNIINANQGIVLSGSTNTSAIDQNCIIQNCTFGSSSTLTAGANLSSSDSVVCYGAYNEIGITITGNTAENITIATPLYLYGVDFFCGLTSSTTSAIYNNIVNNITSTKSSSTCKIGGINVVGGIQNTIRVYGNTLATINMPKALIFGIYYTGGTSDTASVYANTINSITSTSNSATSLYGIYAASIENVSGNTINTVTNLGSTLTAGIYYVGSSNAGSIYSNSLISVTSTSNSSTNLYGIYAVNALNIYGNSCNTLTCARGVLAGIYCLGNSSGSSSIHNNVFNGSFSSTSTSSGDTLYGICAAGSNVSIYSITFPTLSTSTANLIGIYLAPTANSTSYISGNTISGISAGGTLVEGIYVSATASTTTTNVSANKIGNITSSSSSSSALTGGIYETGTTSTVNIYNNFVYNIENNAATSSSNIVSRGIDIEETNEANVYFNSIYLSGSGAVAGTACLYIASGSGANADVRDNIFKNYYSTSQKSYCVYIAGGGLNESDYNIFDVTATGVFYTGYSGTPYPGLAAWSGAIGGDGDSKQFTVNFISATNLHLAVYITDTRYYGNSTSPALNIPVTTDIDGQARVIPIIGADEITFSVPSVVFSTNAPPATDISQSSTINLLYGIKLTDYNAATQLTSIAFTTAGGYVTGDFLNFQLWSSASATFSTGTATSIATISGNPASGSNITFTPSTSLSLTTGSSTYLYITFDVSGTATLGDSVSIKPLDSSLVTLSPLAYKLGSADTLVQKLTTYGADQTIVKFYYNTGYKTGGSSDLTINTAWNSNLSGTGGSPSVFSLPNQVFDFVDATSYIMGGALTITGLNSLLIVGDGINPITFIPTQQIVSTASNPVNVLNNADLKFSIDPASTTLGILSSGSTVEYGSAGASQSVLSGSYYNLTLSGSGNRNLANNVSVAGAFTPNTYTAFTSNTGTMTFNGTATQTVPGFTYTGLTINNTSGTTTKISGNITINGALNVTTAFDIPALKILTLGSSGTIPSTTGGLTIDGTLINPVAGTSPITSSAASLTFSATGTYWLTAAPTGTTSTAEIPTATWATYSLCKITGIVGPSAADYDGLTGINQGFSNLYIDCPNQIGRFVVGFNATGSGGTLQVNDTLTINSTGTGVATNNATKVIQLTSLSGQTSITVGSYIQHGGSVYISDNTTTNGSRTLTVNNNFIVDNANVSPTAADTSHFYINDPNSSNQIIGTLNVAGNFLMSSGTYLKNNNRGIGTISFGGVFFTGASAQNASFGNVGNGINFSVSNSTNTVTLLTNLSINIGALSLTGKLAINGNTLTINGSPNTYYGNSATYGFGYAFSGSGATGTLTGSTTSKLIIGSSASPAPVLKFTNTTARSTNALDSLGIQASASLNSASAGVGPGALYIVGGSSTSPGVISVNTSGAVFSTSDSLTLESDVNGTARVDANTVGSSSYISGKVTVERYFPSHRSWRLVTAPVSSTNAPTINASWQEGASDLSRLAPVDPNPGYGTIITKSTVETSNGAGGTTDGYDQGSTNNPSILSYNSSHNWVLPATTTLGAITAQPGYMLFARGSRNYYVAGTNVPPTSTTLRVKGLLNQGTQSISGNGLQVLGNPYASTIYFDGLSSRSTNGSGGPGMADYYYIWDPFMTGSNSVGSFVLVTQTGTHAYQLVPDPRYSDSLNTPHAADTTGAIQSGQAIIVNYGVSGTNSSSIQETDKAIANDNYSFRPEAPASPLTDSTQEFRTNLYAVNSDSTTSLEDGVLNLYNNDYTDSVDLLQDAPKLGNFAETIAILRDGYYLALEGRKIIGVTDSIFYRIFGMQQKAYIIEFIASNGMNHPGLSGFLVDSFLHTLTPVSLNGVTDIKFAVTSNPASSATNRFTVIFIPALGSPLPVTFTSVKATQQIDKNIAVQWNIENQLNIKQYEVEKSADGVNFTVVNTTAAIGNNISSIAYNWVDDNAVTGDNYYRIISIGDNGVLSYSQIVDVKIGVETPPAIVVYPNPIKDGEIGLQLNNMPAGIYSLQLVNDIGQVLLSTSVSHPGGSVAQTIQFNNSSSKGVYTLEVIHPDMTKTSIKLMVQ